MQKKPSRPIKIALFSATMCWALGASAWKPTKPVNLVVPFSAGSASDQMARSI